MQRLLILEIVTAMGCSTVTGAETGAVFDEQALARYSPEQRAFVQGHALGVLAYTRTVPDHTQGTGFTYTPGLSAADARVAYDWNEVVPDANRGVVTIASSSGCDFDTCTDDGGGDEGGDDDDDPDRDDDDDACETFLEPAADDGKVIIARLDLDAIVGSEVMSSPALRARFDAGVAQALGTEEEADEDPGVELGPIREQAIEADLCTHSPLVLDLDGTGIEASAVSDGVRFDLLGTGTAVATAWPTKGALLVLDRDGDGTITSGAELFGNGPDARDGFAALATLDRPAEGGNGDGVIDHRDVRFHELHVWRDADRDGRSRPGELALLSTAGVAALPLAHETSRARDAFGNPHHEVGSFARTDGTHGAVVDVWFRYRRAR